MLTDSSSEGKETGCRSGLKRGGCGPQSPYVVGPGEMTRTRNRKGTDIIKDVSTLGHTEGGTLMTETGDKDFRVGDSYTFFFCFIPNKLEGKLQINCSTNDACEDGIEYVIPEYSLLVSTTSEKKPSLVVFQRQCFLLSLQETSIEPREVPALSLPEKHGVSVIWWH